MIVRMGWNSQYARRKFDIELDDADLNALMLEHRINVSDPASMAPSYKHQALTVEAELLGLQGALRAGAIEQAEVPAAHQRMDQLRAERASLWAGWQQAAGVSAAA